MESPQTPLDHLAHNMHEIAHVAVDKQHPLRKQAIQMRKVAKAANAGTVKPLSSKSRPVPPPIAPEDATPLPRPNPKQTTPDSAHTGKIINAAKEFLAHKLRDGVMQIYIPKTLQPLLSRIESAKMLLKMLQSHSSDSADFSSTLALERGVSTHLVDLYAALRDTKQRGWVAANPHVLAASGYRGARVAPGDANKFHEHKKQLAAATKKVEVLGNGGKAPEIVRYTMAKTPKKAPVKPKRDALTKAISETPPVERESGFLQFL